MTPTEQVLHSLRDLGLNPKKTRDGWQCRCPAHDDRTPSLSIKDGDEGCVLLHCHAGCSIDSICAALKLTSGELFHHSDTKPAHRNGKDRARAKQPPQLFPLADSALKHLDHRMGKHSSLWVYRNASGEPVGVIARWNLDDGGKDIRPISRSDDGKGWICGGMPLPRPLYRLPELLAAPLDSLVYVVEGEKAADAAATLAVVATTSPHGAKSAAKADWSPLAGKAVVILPDNDAAGVAYANDVATLAGHAGASSVRIVRLVELWAEMPEGGDILDFIQHRGGDLESVRKEIVAVQAIASNERHSPRDGSPRLVRLCDVRAESVAWLWPGRIALGKLTLIAGDPGLGKSFLTLDIAARITRAAAWPDLPDAPTTKGGVVLLNAEDGIADTIRARFDAAGGDASKVVIIDGVNSMRESGQPSERGFDLSTDLPALEVAINSCEGCKLVVIDPVTAYLGGVDSHKNAEIRGLLAPLSTLAGRHNIAVVVVTHLNKSGGGPAIYRAMGSLAFAAAARAVWGVTKDKEDGERRLFLPIKNNIAPNMGGLAYRITQQSSGGACVRWEPDPVNTSADDALSSERDGGGDRTDLDDAADWLGDQLREGPRQVKDIERDAQDAGYSKATLRRAKARIGAVAAKAAYDGGWEWMLPTPAEGAQTSKMLIEGAQRPPNERLRENTARTYEIPAETPKALKAQGMSAFNEHVGAGAGPEREEL